MKTVIIEGREYRLRTLPLELAPQVFEVVKKMMEIAGDVVKESSEPVPEGDDKLKVFMAIVDYTQEKLREAKFFRGHPEPLDISSGRISADAQGKAVKTAEPEEK